MQISNRCELDDKDHPAVHAVEYSFHKTYELSSARPIFLGWKNREVMFQFHRMKQITFIGRLMVSRGGGMYKVSLMYNACSCTCTLMTIIDESRW